MPKLPPKKPQPKDPADCVACGGTGQATSGSECYPCGGTGKKKPPNNPAVYGASK